jgi:hypothetical protein
MTIELERRDILNRTVRREVLQPGVRRTLEPMSLIRPLVHLDVVSENEVRILRSYAGETIEEVLLEKDQINKSPRTFSYLNKFRVSWRKD